MRTGKIAESVLKRSVLKYCREPEPKLLQGAGVGADCAVFAAGSESLSGAVSAALIDQLIKVRYCLEHAVNNLACSGHVAAWALLGVLLPEDAPEAFLGELMAEAKSVCSGLHVAIAGGHTEVTDAVQKPFLTATALGAPDACAANLTGLRPGMDLLVIGDVGREGAALLAESGEAALRERFPLDFVEEAKKLGGSVSVAREALAAARLGAAALHDVSQGGVFGALWEMLEGAKAGMEADLRKIPIRQETVEVCEFFGKNPYCLLSGGALLAAAENGRELAARLRAEGISAALIGRTTPGNGCILRNGEETRFLDRPAQDEIYRSGQKDEVRRGAVGAVTD